MSEDPTDERATPSSDTGEASEQTDLADRRQYTPEGTALLVDGMCGKLATYLRMCGYDATFAGERGVDTDDEALAVATTEDRVIVTRDTSLARAADRVVLLTTREVTEQLRELAGAGFELALASEPSRCSACNAPLERVDRTEPTPDYAPEPHEEAVWRCRSCGQHFWKGSHWDDVAETLQSV